MSQSAFRIRFDYGNSTGYGNGSSGITIGLAILLISPVSLLLNIVYMN